MGKAMNVIASSQYDNLDEAPQAPLEGGADNDADASVSVTTDYAPPAGS